MSRTSNTRAASKHDEETRQNKMVMREERLRSIRNGEAARAELTARAQVHSTVLIRQKKTKDAAIAAAAGV